MHDRSQQSNAKIPCRARTQRVRLLTCQDCGIRPATLRCGRPEHFSYILLLSLLTDNSGLGQSSFALQELFSNCNLTDLPKSLIGDHTEHQKTGQTITCFEDIRVGRQELFNSEHDDPELELPIQIDFLKPLLANDLCVRHMHRNELL
jgi:hypothetical protein